MVFCNTKRYRKKKFDLHLNSNWLLCKSGVETHNSTNSGEKLLYSHSQITDVGETVLPCN